MILLQITYFESAMLFLEMNYVQRQGIFLPNKAKLVEFTTFRLLRPVSTTLQRKLLILFLSQILAQMLKQ